jgi:hypothetical protein
MKRLSEVIFAQCSHDALSGEANEEAHRKRSSVLLAWRLLTCSRLVSINSRVGRAFRLNHGAHGITLTHNGLVPDVPRRSTTATARRDSRSLG